MKRSAITWPALLLTLTLLAGCQSANSPAPSAPAQTPAPTQTSAPAETPAPTQTSAPAETTAPTQAPEADNDMERIYAPRLSLYQTALSQHWDANTFFNNEMSDMAADYYYSDPMENVGFALTDLNRDGYEELIIGAIDNAENYPIVFEIWTWSEGWDTPRPVLVSQVRNRYFLEYTPEDDLYFISNEGSNGAACQVYYFYTLEEGELHLVQGLVFDAIADEKRPWFLTSDEDLDVSNDTPVSEELAQSILDSHQANRIIPEYTPFSLYPQP